MEKISSILISTGIALSLFSGFAQAQPLAQRCDLGQACHIPGDDGGLTYYDITPTSGTQYTCNITADKGEMYFMIYGGKNFKLQDGSGLHKADPNTSVAITGSFENANNPNDIGQIKIFNLTKDATGSIVCLAK